MKSRAGVFLLLAFLAACATRTTKACTNDAECPTGEICESNRCQAALCSQDWSPVCGEDGKTYSNACMARIQHVPIARPGECDEPSQPPEGRKACGTIAGIECGAGEICELPPGKCGGADLGGVCVPKPEACTQIYAPVCGCDAKTYSNDCMRLMTSVQKDRDGECPSPEPSPEPSPRP